jgi:hypothetical protein
MRGGRNIVERRAQALRGAWEATLARSTLTGMRACLTFGRPWKPQQEQIPLQSSGAIGRECSRTDGCADATAKETPSHRSQCGGFVVNQNSNAQSSDAQTRYRFLLFTPLTIMDRSKKRLTL